MKNSEYLQSRLEVAALVGNSASVIVGVALVRYQNHDFARQATILCDSVRPLVTPRTVQGAICCVPKFQAVAKKVWRMNETAKDYFLPKDGEALITEEKECIRQYRKRVEDENWYGVALSGGGIRSAIFSLGALQALAAKDVLPSFDYISSVSGGGYISASLQWIWRNNRTTGTSQTNFPFGTSLAYRSDDESKDRRLSYLRSHGQYLIPDERLSIWSLAAVVIRTLFLNLTVWLPAGGLAYIVLVWLARKLLIFVPFLANLPNVLSFII